MKRILRAFLFPLSTFLFPLLSTFLFPLPTHAQVAQWLVPPVYDDIELPADANIVIADSANITTTLWSISGRRLLTTKDLVNSYSDGFVVTTNKDDAYITGIYDSNGNSLPFEKVQLGWGYPMFHDGHLLVHDGYYFYYMDANGQIDNTQYVRAYPFSGGFASCYTYENIRKQKDPYYILIDKNLKEVPLTCEGKPLGRGDVDFISSVNDEGLAVISVKHKLYYFEASTKELRPLYATPDEDNIKNQGKMDGDLGQCYVSEEDSSFLRAKCGRAGNIEIVFDALLKPIAIKHDGARHEFASKQASALFDNSMLQSEKGSDGKYNLQLNGKEILPPQFDKVIYISGDKAIVMLNDKCGLLQIHPNDKLQLSLNKGNPIAFRHRRFDTTIRLDMPSYINPRATNIEMDNQTGCIIDKISKETKNTDIGNYVQYNCVLNVPQSIPDDETTELTYPLYIVHEGLRTPIMSVKADAWHYKYYNVDISETSISNGALFFTTNISAERLPGEDLYPYTCKLITENVSWEMVEKVSETRYKWKVNSLKEGNNNVIVSILEEGCPPSNYTFELDYNKPVANTPKAPVIMKEKKAKTVTPPIRRDHLDI